MVYSVVLFFKFIASFIPTRLPVGITEFEYWSASIIELTGPIADEDSLKYVLAAQIMAMAPTTGRVAKSHFVNSLRKAAANQVAAQVFQDIKTKQLERSTTVDTASSQPVEATTPEVVASDDKP